MKQDYRLRTASLLMSLSILLLVMLQAYWLRNAWFDEYRRLKRELTVLLRETVAQQEMQQFILLNGDGAPLDSVFLRNIQSQDSDTGSLKDANGRMRYNVVISSESARLKMPPRMLNFDHEQRYEEDDNTRSLTISFPALLGNSNLDTLQVKYAKALKDAGINLPCKLSKSKNDSNRSSGEIRIKNNRSLRQERFRRFKTDMIQAEFERPSFVLLQKIKWQLLFAVIMVLVTGISFLFLYRNLRQQQRLAALKNDFIANITHELKTPIATVSVAIEALKSFDVMQDREKTSEYLDISGNELNRLNLLVDKVLKLSMLGQQKIELQQTSIDVQQLLQEVLNNMKLQFETRDADIRFIAEGDHYFTMGDRMHLLSVFYNLLDNALKYSLQRPRIDVDIRSMENTIQVVIVDNGIGIGIADVHRNKIFDKFFWVPHGNTHNIKGYGLGLSYGQEVLKSHGGNIRLESEEGKGSVFTVTLIRAER